LSAKCHKLIFGAQLAEADTESISLPPCDTAGAGGPKIIETQFERYRGMHRSCELKTRAGAREIAYVAIDQ